MSNITISDLKPVQSQNEAMSDAELNMITGGGDIGISPYVKPYYDFSGKFGVEIGVKFTIKF